MIRLSGKQPGADIEIVYTGLRPGEKLEETLFHNDEPSSQTFLAILYIVCIIYIRVGSSRLLAEIGP